MLWHFEGSIGGGTGAPRARVPDDTSYIDYTQHDDGDDDGAGTSEVQDAVALRRIYHRRHRRARLLL